MRKKALPILCSAVLLISIVLTYGITVAAVRHGDDAQLASTHNTEETDLLHMLSQGYLAEIFFGEWIVIEMISTCRRLAAIYPETAAHSQELIGTKIYMSYEDILIDGEALSESPWYHIIIRSMEPTPHPQFLPGPTEVIRTPFCVYVNVELLGLRNLSGKISDEVQFYVKDENTLYLIYSNAFFRLERS